MTLTVLAGLSRLGFDAGEQDEKDVVHPEL